MDRRRFLQMLGLGATMLAGRGRARAETLAPKEIALTFDDPEPRDYPGYPASEVDRRLRKALSESGLKTVLFVCGKRVDNEAGRGLLRAWSDEGHALGNHSYSHHYFHSPNVTLQQYEEDAARGEALLRGFPRFQKIFRFPFFKEGDTAEKRDGMRAWLSEHGYRVGGATIDASDWAIDDRLRRRLEINPTADLGAYRAFFLEHIWARATYYDQLAAKAWKKPVRHTVLLHHKLLTALFVKDLVALFRERGWKVVDATYAFDDPIYRERPKILPAGEGVVWALAKERGIEGLRYPGEDDTYENPEMERQGL
jgi:peptidoglycan/xylan/chitin deacetylase (PgdA/CDA1 family)